MMLGIIEGNTKIVTMIMKDKTVESLYLWASKIGDGV
jgi:hypothetical protein